MNIKLVYRETNFNLDVMEEAPCQQLYRVAQKVFRKKQSDIILFYGKKQIENDSRLLFDVMGKEDKEDILEEEIVTVKLKKELFNEFGETKFRLKTLKQTTNNSNSSDKLPTLLKSGFSLDKKKGKKLPIKCQICSHKNSIFYCRECNIFVCFECNIRYTEHHRHKRINLEDGDTKLGIQTYKEKILGELKLIDSGYKKFSKWIISNIDRDNFLTTTFKLLEKIKRNSQRLSDINTLYNIDQDMINNLKSDIEQTKVPFAQEELIDIFSSLNAKDKEIENYIKYVDLQIIKTEYNKILVNYISNAQKNFKKIIEEVESKLRECDDIKFWGITEIKLYLKDKKKKKINFDIFNNEENNKLENNKNGFSNSSEPSDIEEEEKLKEFKMNLNLNSENILNSEIFTDRKNSHNEGGYKEKNKNLDSTKKRKSVINLTKDVDLPSFRKTKRKSNRIRKNTFKNENKNDDKNKNEKDEYDYTNNINIKSRNNQYPTIKIKTSKNENFFIDKKDTLDNGFITKRNNNDLIKSLMDNFDGDTKEKLFFSPNKRISSNEYPLILTNRNQNSDSNEKYIQLNYKKYKDSGKYGKKLNYVLKQKNAKKD